jgi:two-component system C4-dicarboxylate transport response regulator DctD
MNDVLVDLEEAVRTGTFRADFYHGITRTRLKLPALREQPEDVPLLFAYFLMDAASTLHLDAPVPNEAQRRHLLAHGWPGNVRELRNHAYVAAGVRALALRWAGRCR